MALLIRQVLWLMDIIHLSSRLIVNEKEDGNHDDALLLFRGARPEGRRIDVF